MKYQQIRECFEGQCVFVRAELCPDGLHDYPSFMVPVRIIRIHDPELVEISYGDDRQTTLIKSEYLYEQRPSSDCDFVVINNIQSNDWRTQIRQKK